MTSMFTISSSLLTAGSSPYQHETSAPNLTRTRLVSNFVTIGPHNDETAPLDGLTTPSGLLVALDFRTDPVSERCDSLTLGE